MNGEQYRTAIDRLSFSEDFEARTIELLREKAQSAAENEYEPMKRAKHKKIFWRVAIALCLVAALSIGGVAAASLLSARETSQVLHNGYMEAAFTGENAIEINETQVMGDYSVTLLSIAPDEEFQGYGGVNKSHDYVMMAFQGNGDVSVKNFLEDYKVTLLVSGYSTEMDHILMQTGHGVFIDDNTLYMCYDIYNLQLFADHDVSMAVYKRKFPVYVDGAWCYQPGDVFTTLEDGAIAFREDFPEEHAIFTLPLDESKADPEAAERLIDEDLWSLQVDMRDPDWRSEDRYDKNYYERQQKALEEAGLK